MESRMEAKSPSSANGKGRYDQSQIRPCCRGNIVDRKGRTTAETTGGSALGIIPGKLGTGEEKERNIKKISKAFDIDEELIDNQLKQAWVTDGHVCPAQINVRTEADSKDIKGVTHLSIEGNALLSL
ncbi:hypothetical protein ACEQPO_05505 [Bacillus sp. SL00103]